MSYLSILVIAVGLAMDAFAISISAGVFLRDYKLKYSLKFGLFFGITQFIVVYVGYTLSKVISDNFFELNNIVAAGILFLFGINMTYQTYKVKKQYKQKEEKEYNDINLLSTKNLVLLSFAASIDAVAVGISLAIVELNINVLNAFILIGFVSFVLAAAGLRIGKYASGFMKDKLGYLGGIILMVLALNIVI